MKALFVRCYGRLMADMMIGGLIDMGVPPVYLNSCLSDAGITADFMEKPNPAAQISAHYFHIFPEAFEGPLYMVSFMARWRSLCEKVHPEWEETGWKVFRALASGLPEGKDDLSLIGVPWKMQFPSTFSYAAWIIWKQNPSSRFLSPLKRERQRRPGHRLRSLRAQAQRMGNRCLQKTSILLQQPSLKDFLPISFPWTEDSFPTRQRMEARQLTSRRGTIRSVCTLGTIPTAQSLFSDAI